MLPQRPFSSFIKGSQASQLPRDGSREAGVSGQAEHPRTAFHAPRGPPLSCQDRRSTPRGPLSFRGHHSGCGHRGASPRFAGGALWPKSSPRPEPASAPGRERSPSASPLETSVAWMGGGDRACSGRGRVGSDILEAAALAAAVPVPTGPRVGAPVRHERRWPRRRTRRGF